jgi:pectate lyase
MSGDGAERALVAVAALAFACDVGSAPLAEDAGTGPASTTTPDAEAPRPAFPGAVGWGASTPGGRGGQIVKVTTLARSGPGSLAAALATAGPRIVVFEVGGVIDLDRLTLHVGEPFVTVAGQTAPPPGITLIRGGIRIGTHDVILQHLRVRPGEAGQAKISGWEIDAIATDDGAHRVIVDHCSTSWGTDENLSASGSRFLGTTPDEWRSATSHAVTFSNNIVAEALANATHAEGEHSKGGLIHDNVTEMTVMLNLYFSNNDRHPLFKGGARGIVVNNYIANPGRWAMMYALNAGEWGAYPYEVGQMSIVGNVFTYGPSTPDGVPLLRTSGQGNVEVFFEDNLSRTRSAAAASEIGGTPALVVAVASPPVWPSGTTAMPASELADYIRENVGARPWDRDAIDARVVEQALAGEGAIIDSETEVGGYPMHEPTSAPFAPAEWDLETMTRKSGN